MSTVEPFEQLLRAGARPDHIRREAERHLLDLQGLPPETPERDAAIQETRTLIARLAAQEGDAEEG